MLKRYITDQDMQIKVAYGDIKRNFNAIDSGVPKHGTEVSGFILLKNINSGK